MRKIVYNQAIPDSTQNLLQGLASSRLANRLAELGANNATQLFRVGAVDGTVDVAGKPGFIYMRAMYPDGTSTVTQCYVPTYEDGSSKVQFQADQLINPTRQSDTNPTYWIYDGIPPTPPTESVALANSFGPVYGNAYPNDDGSISGDDRALPNVLNVTNVGRYSDGVTTPLTYTLTDSGQKDPATGERLYYRDYTGPDYNPDPVPAGTSRAPQPPSNDLVSEFFDPCGDGSRPPLKKPPLGNHPYIPPIRPTLPKLPLPRVPDKKLPKAPPSGFRKPPNSPPYVPPYRPPYVPPRPLPPVNPAPPTGPGTTPPGGGGGSGGGGGGGGGDLPGTGGTWYDDGVNVTGCFGVPWLLDSQIVVSNSASDPYNTSTTLTRSYYNIRPQIDSAIKKLIGSSYRPQDLLYVTLVFDGINEERQTVTQHDGSFEYTEGPFLQPRVFRTNYAPVVPVDATYYFDEPPAPVSKDFEMPPSATLTTSYEVFEFTSLTIGTPIAPVACDPLHYSYTLNTLPAYADSLLPLLADHPGYRLYLSCFMVKKNNSGAAKTLPYTHDFSAGQDDWSFSQFGGYDASQGYIYDGQSGIRQQKAMTSPGWIKGWTVTATGWNNRTPFIGPYDPNAGVVTLDVYSGFPSVGNRIASGTKNGFEPQGHGGPYTFTWQFNNSGDILYSPCTEYYFVIGGGQGDPVIIKTIAIAPITGSPTAPDGTPGTGPSDPVSSSGPINGSGSPLTAGTPVTSPAPLTSSSGDDGKGANATGPAGAASGGNGPATGFARNDTPPNAPVDIQTSGTHSGYAGLIPGKDVYLSATGGQLTQTKPDCSGCLNQKLGTAVDSTTISIDIGPVTKRL